MSALDEVDLHLVEGVGDVLNFEDWLQRGPMRHGLMAIDTETTGLSRRTDHVRLLQMGDGTDGWAMAWDRWSGLLVDVLTRFNGTILMHNAPFDQPMIAKMGVEIETSRIQDVLPLVKMLEPHLPAKLKKAAARHVDPQAGSAQKELDAAIAKLGWAGVPIEFEPYWMYGALDPVLTFLLRQALQEHVREDEAFQHGYDVENSVQWILSRMTDKGIPVDVEYAREQREKITRYSATAYDWCVKEYGVKPGSNAAVVERLMRDGWEFAKRTETGAWALDKEVLEEIDHPLAQTVLRRRQLDKIGSTYLDHYIDHNREGRVHPSINPMGARTSRMSVSSPNFQNLPRVSEDNPAATIVRNCVVAGQGKVLLFCDFSQIETRLLAHLSQDPGLIGAFHLDEDFFVTLARQVFKDPTINKKDQRRNAIKTWVYAKIYGAGLEKLAKTLGMSTAEMRQFDDSITAAYPGIRSFQLQIQTLAIRRAREEGVPYVVCPMSGRRHVADRGKEYALVNYLIQGLAAFFFKKKLLELDAAGLGEYMILPVHDEIILEVPVEQAQWAVQILIDVMNDADTFRVPVAAEVSYGYRWGEKKDWSTWSD
jgi:DNA polymerase-1